MADKIEQSEFSGKRNQLGSFTIQDILRFSSTEASDFPSHPDKDGHRPKETDRKKHDVKAIKCGTAMGGSKVSDTGKRIRTIFTQEQLDKLEASFERQQYMIRSERSQLAAALNLQEAQVKVWFQNRRIKWRKQQHEATMVKIRAYQEATTTRAPE